MITKRNKTCLWRRKMCVCAHCEWSAMSRFALARKATSTMIIVDISLSLFQCDAVLRLSATKSGLYPQASAWMAAQRCGLWTRQRQASFPSIADAYNGGQHPEVLRLATSITGNCFSLVWTSLHFECKQCFFVCCLHLSRAKHAFEQNEQKTINKIGSFALFVC